MTIHNASSMMTRIQGGAVPNHNMRGKTSWWLEFDTIGV